jgi:hypothetical protein
MADEKELLAIKRNPKVLEIYAKSVDLHKEDAGRWRGKCPFGSDHKRGEDRTPSFDVYIFDDGSYGYKCLGCGNSGNIFQFLIKTDKITFDKAVKKAKEIVGGTWFEGREVVEETFHKPIEEEPKSYLVLPVSNADKFTEALRNSSEARTFLRSRSIDIETACKLRIGFRQSMPDPVKCPPDIRHAGWLVFPYIEGNKVIRVKFRSIKSKFFTQMKGMEQRGLYNSEAADPLKPLFLVEGELDVAALASAGFNAVSLFNATHEITPADKDVLMASSELFLAGDRDGAAGEEKMKKLWSELQENTYLLQWPDGNKDANDLLRNSDDLGEFKTEVLELMQTARSQPMPGIYSLQEAMLASNNTDMANHPQRLHFPWPGVDNMAICLPGSVVAVTASSTGMGKTQFLMQATLDSAVKHGETILNYQAEMSPDEIANMVTAHILAKDRNELSSEDYKEAAARIRGARYYLGSNNDLQTSTQVLDLIEHAIRRLSPTIVVLDHLHHICQNVKDEIQDQSNAMKRIKGMAQRYGVKFIVVGQPRKSNQQSRGKEIYMSDLKGSEAIQSASDAVFILHREFLKEIDPAHPPLDVFSPETKITLHKGRTKGRGAAVCNLILRGKIATFVDEEMLANNIEESPKEGESFSDFLSSN